jgi:predicted nucleic acid-binding protein
LTLYLDTSLLVAALTNETETRRMQAWLGEQEPSDLAISDWVITEFSAALSMKLRSGQIEVIHRADALGCSPAERRQLHHSVDVRLAIPHSGTVRGPARVGLARW